MHVSVDLAALLTWMRLSKFKHQALLNHHDTATLFLNKSTNAVVASSSPLPHLHSLFISSSTKTRTYSISPATSLSTPSSSNTDSLELLQQHLAAQNFREADEETRRLLIFLVSEAAQKRGYVFFSEVQFIPVAQLKFFRVFRMPLTSR